MQIVERSEINGKEMKWCRNEDMSRTPKKILNLKLKGRCQDYVCLLPLLKLEVLQ
jgi:hypothetical protein